MPAHRSRTERWRELLDQIAHKGGGIEFSVARPPGGGPDLLWRVRVYHVSDTEIIVESPTAMGKGIAIDPALELVAVLAVGQNRWMFRTRSLGTAPALAGRAAALRLAMPENVERCARRDFLRVSTAALTLPNVECWPLLDPSSVFAAELANRLAIQDLERTGGVNPAVESLLPEVGPKFQASLMNIGGGGAGLLVTREDAAAASRTRLFWMRVNLTPLIPAPLAMTAKCAHSHLDSAQNLYIGAAFEFAFHPAHREFVTDQIGRYVRRLTAASLAA